MDYIHMKNINIVNYAKELKTKKYKKGMAFLDYFNDIQHDCLNGQEKYNSQRYYASNWDISATTAHAWIREFDKFLAYIYI